VNNLDIFEGLTELEAKIVVELANRNGRTYEEIAKAVGISERHLYRYRQKSHIKRAVRELAVQELESEIPDIMQALKRNIKKGDFRSIELAVKMLGLLVEKKEINQTTTIKDNRLLEMSDDDINEELQAIERELRVIKGGAE
jgi:AcrR family transcriptional regulator